MTIVGTASVVVTADTAGFAESVKAESSGAFTQLGSDADAAGKDAGASLRTGVTDETGKLADDVGSDAEKAGGKLESGMGGSIEKLKSSLESLGIPSGLLTGAAAGTAAIGLVAVAGVDLAEKMQSADAAIATASGSSVASAKAIGNAFLGTAGSTEFSGQEIATAYATVAGQMKATEGQTLSTSSAMAVMNAAQDLATAKQISLGTATSTLASVMQAFQLPVKDAAAATDVLFNVSNDTGQGVDTVGAALDKLKSKLGDTSPPLGALGALMVDMTNNGITGRASLTAVNGAMTSLAGAAADGTKVQQASNAALQSMGVSATTASGQLTPMSTIIDQLGPKFATMTQAQQLNTATIIFGASAAKQMTTVIDAGSASYDKASASVTKMGSAHAAAAVQSDTLAVEFKTIKAAGDDWLTQLGQGLMPILTKFIGIVGGIIPVVASVISWFGKMSAPALAIAAAIGAVLVPVIIAWGVTTTVTAAKAAADMVVTAAKQIASFVEMGAGAVAASATQVGAWIATGAGAIAGFASQIPAFAGTAAGWVASGVEAVTSSAIQVAAWVATAAAATAAFVAENAAMLGIGVAIIALVAGAVWLGTHWKEVWSDIKAVASDAWHFIESNVVNPIKTAFDDAVTFIKTHWELLAVILLAPFAPVVALVAASAILIKGHFTEIKDFVLGIWDDIRTTASTMVDDVVNFFKSIPGKIGNLGKDILDKITGGLGSLASSAMGAIASVFGAGGIVTQPTLAIVGDKGPEAIIPLTGTTGLNVSGTGAMPLPTGSSSVGTPSFGSTAGSSPLVGGDMIINAYGTNMSATDLMSEVGWSLKTNQFTSTPAVA
jgi:TP901 family phage tail tape measure protein